MVAALVWLVHHSSALCTLSGPPQACAKWTGAEVLGPTNDHCEHTPCKVCIAQSPKATHMEAPTCHQGTLVQPSPESAHFTAQPCRKFLGRITESQFRWLGPPPKKAHSSVLPLQRARLSGRAAAGPGPSTALTSWPPVQGSSAGRESARVSTSCCAGNSCCKSAGLRIAESLSDLLLERKIFHSTLPPLQLTCCVVQSLLPRPPSQACP